MQTPNAPYPLAAPHCVGTRCDRRATFVVVAAIALLGACSLSGFQATPCDSNEQCQRLFGDESMCVDDFCTTPVDADVSTDAAADVADTGDAASDTTDTTDVDDVSADADGDTDVDDAEDGSGDTCTPVELFVDNDGDNVGSGDPVEACPGDGFANDDGDCNDDDDTVFPDAAELVGNGIDEDCDDRETCYVDADGDGHRAADAQTATVDALQCTGLFLDNTAPSDDCDDDNELRYGAFAELCDGIDNDCDGTADDGLTFVPYFADVDGDTFGDDALGSTAYCSEPDNSSTVGGDCDDSLSAINPDADETVGDGVDSDCDDAEVCYADADDDGQRPGDGSLTIASADTDCNDSREALSTEPTGDCDDATAEIGADFDEVCGDGVDNDCTAGSPCRIEGDLLGAVAFASFSGADPDGRFGASLLLADYNNDGSADLIVGDPERGVGGAVFVFFGPLDEGRTIAGNADIEILAPLAGAFGTSLAFGEMTGDERLDLIVGAPTHSSSRGAIYVADPTVVTSGTVTLTAPAVTGFATGDAVGTALVGIGNIDGEDCDEIVAGAPGVDDGTIGDDIGAVYFFTCNGVGTKELRNAFRGAIAGAELGTAVTAGDLDGRPPIEIVMGAPGADGATGATPRAGRVYVSVGPPPGNGSLADGASALIGPATDSGVGSVLASIGDVNNDDFADLFIGAPSFDASNSDVGAAFIVLGVSNLSNLDQYAISTASRIEGSLTSDGLGTALTGLGDLDADGFSDYACYQAGATGGGRTLIQYGQATIPSRLLPGDIDTAIVGGPGSALGAVMTGNADLTGDGVLDIVVATPSTPLPDSGGDRGGVLIFEGASL